MKIIIAGSGCMKCNLTEKNVINACAELNIDADITHSRDVKEYLKIGVMITPAVVVNDRVVVSGRVPTVEELKKILSELLSS